MKKTFLTYDNIKNKTGVVYQRICDLNAYYNFPVDDWNFQTTTTLDATLNTLADQGVDYVVVSALGNFLRLGGINDDNINECIAASSPLSAHLLDKDGYYSIDPQFFCLHLPTWTQVGRPKFEDSAPLTFESCNVDRSEENYHDNYTPYWIKPATGTKIYTVPYAAFGSSVLRTFLEQGHTLINIGEKTRNRKVYLYPNYNYDDIDTWIKDPTYIPKSIPVQKYAKHINDLYEMDSKTVYVLNSEPLTGNQGDRIDYYAGVCGGLKGVAILYKKGFHDGTVVELFDISQPALDYQRYLVENWDGDFANYQTVLSTYQAAHPDLIYAWRNWNTWESEIEVFLQSAKMNAVSFKQTWQRYIKLPITYTQLDLHDTDAVTKFFSAPKSGTRYIWVSNAFHMEHTIARNGSAWLKERAKHLRSSILRTATHIWLEKENVLQKAQ
jgi:hypothetical protein